MSRVTVWLLGVLSIGFGAIFYAIGYAAVRPVLLEVGLLAYVPALGGLTTVVGLLLVLGLTWFVFVWLFSALGIDKM